MNLIRHDQMRQALEAWATQKTGAVVRGEEYRAQKMATVQAFWSWLHLDNPATAGPEDVASYAAHLRQEGYGPGTIYGLISRISSFYLFASGGRFNPVTAEVRPAVPLPYNTEKSKALTDEELSILYGYLGEMAHTEFSPKEQAQAKGYKRDWALLVFYIYSGKRLSEILSLRWGDLSFTDGALLIRTLDKGGLWRQTEIRQSVVVEALRHYMGARWDRLKAEGERAVKAPLWLRHDRASVGEERLGRRGWHKRFVQHCLDAGIGHKTTHQLRHTFARIVGEETQNMTTLQYALGHSSVRTTQVYYDKVRVRKDGYSEMIEKRIKK